MDDGCHVSEVTITLPYRLADMAGGGWPGESLSSASAQWQRATRAASPPFIFIFPKRNVTTDMGWRIKSNRSTCVSSDSDSRIVAAIKKLGSFVHQLLRFTLLAARRRLGGRPGKIVSEASKVGEEGRGGKTPYVVDRSRS
uniref:Uncharacterized protein n=1 Tax=Hordeum vulgare subsp. vulgare TaxID=112509 RepID=A0A8I7BDH1_HORVV